MNKCIVDTCNEQAVARGLCARHYQQVRRHGKINEEVTRNSVCSEEGCNNPVYSRGLCRKHYNALRWRERNGFKKLL